VLEKKLTCQIICNFIDRLDLTTYNVKKKVICCHLYQRTMVLGLRKGGCCLHYIVFIGIILLISWGVRLLIHRDLKTRKRLTGSDLDRKEDLSGD
jgi:hypothetical protein